MNSYFDFVIKPKTTLESAYHYRGDIYFNDYAQEVRVNGVIINLTTNREEKIINFTVPMKIFFNIDKVIEKLLL